MLFISQRSFEVISHKFKADRTCYLSDKFFTKIKWIIIVIERRNFKSVQYDRGLWVLLKTSCCSSKIIFKITNGGWNCTWDSLNIKLACVFSVITTNHPVVGWFVNNLDKGYERRRSLPNFRYLLSQNFTRGTVGTAKHFRQAIGSLGRDSNQRALKVKAGILPTRDVRFRVC
jgi:hypothetical protein